MNNSTIYLKRDRTCYISLDKGVIINNDSPIDLQSRCVKFLKFLCENKEKPCTYYDIFVNTICPKETNPETDYKYKGKDRIVDIRKQLAKELARYEITLGTAHKDLEEKDITIINSDETYTIYLGADHNHEAIRQQIADTYYETHQTVDVDINFEEINKNLLEVFYFPSFVDEKQLDLSQNRRYYICAPNGFGKSTLLKTLLLATNPSTKINKTPKFANKIKDIKQKYGIKQNYLALFVDLKNANEQNAFKNDDNLLKWLLFASKLDNILRLDEFSKLIAYYNQHNGLILIFDSIDEIIQRSELSLNREDILTKIRLLVSADGFCNNAKVILASRPLTFAKDDMPYEYLYIDSLVSQQDQAESIIENYSSADEKDYLINYIYEDSYLKNLVTTPQLLVSAISRILLNKYNQTFGIIGGGKYKLIQDMLRDTLMRFENKKNLKFSYHEKNLEEIYEIFSYVSLFNYIENKKSDFAKFQELILNNALNHTAKHKKPITASAITDAYEHFCLFNTQKQNLEFLAPKVLGPYYLSSYMRKRCKQSQYDELHNPMKLFDSIQNNIYNNNDCLYDMLVFFFGLIHEGITGDSKYNPDSLEYKLWIDYIVYKWNALDNQNALKERLKYLVESDFVKDSCFTRILSSRDNVLSDSEVALKNILKEICYQTEAN